MSQYKAGFSLSDAYGRVTTRSFIFEAADFANASTLMGTFTTAYQGVTELHLFESRLVEEENIAGAPVGGSNVDEGMTISAQLATPGKKASIQVPSPVAAIINVDATIDLTDALMIALEGQYTKSTPFVTASDGETVDSFIKGTLDR